MGGGCLRQGAGHGPHQIDGRESPALRDGPVEDDMAVENAPQDVRQRSLHIAAGNEHREDGSDVPRPLRPRARTLGQGHDLGCGGGGKARNHRRLSACGGHLPVRFGVAGDRVRQKQDVAAVVAEPFGHGQRRGKAAGAVRRGTVGGGGDDHRPRHALRSERALDEIAHLPAAFADQGQHDHVRLDAAGKGRKQGRFAYTGSGKQPDPLTAHDRQHRVERAKAGGQPRPHRAPGGGGGSGGEMRQAHSPRKQRTPVEGTARWIDDAADPAGIRSQGRRALGQHAIAGNQPGGRAVQKHRDSAVRGADDLTAHGADTHCHALSKTSGARQARHPQHAFADRVEPSGLPDHGRTPDGGRHVQ